jgi:hypothetical protein
MANPSHSCVWFEKKKKRRRGQEIKKKRINITGVVINITGVVALSYSKRWLACVYTTSTKFRIKCIQYRNAKNAETHKTRHCPN